MESHLLQMRGLKLFFATRKVLSWVVASFTDAWIETVDSTTIFQPQTVASFTDAWIETDRTIRRHQLGESRIFYRCVD